MILRCAGTSWVCFGALVALAACGGGGPATGSNPFNLAPRGSAPAPSAPPSPAPSPGPATAEGFWTGRTTTGLIFNVLVKPDGEVWGIYGQSGQAWGGFKGVSTLSGQVFSASTVDYYIRGGAIYNMQVNGTVTPQHTLAGSYTGGNPGGFTASYDVTYDTPAMLADIVGQWTFVGATSVGLVSTTAQIAANGDLSGSNAFCTVSAGRITPSASGKNYFDAQATFSGANCQFNGRTITGVGVLFADGARRSLGVAGLLPDGSDGFIGFGTR